MQKESLHNKSLMGFKILRSWRSGIFFSKSQQVGRFLIFQSKLLFFVAGRCSFWVKVGNLFYKISPGRTLFFSSKTSFFFDQVGALFGKKTTIYWHFFQEKRKRKEKAFPLLATSQNLPGVQARRRFFFLRKRLTIVCIFRSKVL